MPRTGRPRETPCPSDSRISSKRVRCRQRFLSCLCFSLVLDTKQVRRLSRGKYVIRGPWEPLVASSLRSKATFQGSRGPLNHVFSATSASNLYECQDFCYVHVLHANALSVSACYSVIHTYSGGRRECMLLCDTYIQWWKERVYVTV